MAADTGRAGLRHGAAMGVATVLMMTAMTLSGCQSMNPLPAFGVGDAAPEEARIGKLLKWHSGRVEVYRGFRTVFTARAVYLSDEIQRLAADWEARSTLMNPEERAAFEKTFLGENTNVIKVLVGFYTPEEQMNDLSDENSFWIPYINNPDGTVIRAACLDADENITRIYMRFLQWDLSWSRLYLLCFPYQGERLETEDGWISMMISGAQGRGTIRLRFDPPEDGS